MKNVAVAAGIAMLTALTWFAFPGHTWLQQDTQIYVPILEHLRDPAVLRRDILVERPHVSFTLYDETARGLARITGLDFRQVLEGEQISTRALGIWGLYLMAAALGLSAPASLLVAGAISLGAAIVGPAVLSFEIEPDPRGFAVPLLFLAIGLVAHGWELAAGIAGAAAFLIHPPTVVPFWAVYAALAIVRRRFKALAPLAAACIILAIAARFQDGASEAQLFFARIPPALERLQRMRAPYSWVSEWRPVWLAYFAGLYAVCWLAYARVRQRVPRDLRFFLIGLPLFGMLSVPASYLLLEKLKWILLPQMQPMRALLFVVVIAEFCAGAAGIVAAQSRRYIEAFAWFLLIYLVAMAPHLSVLTAVILAVFAAGAAWSEAPAALAAATAAAFIIIPALGGVRTHPQLHTPDLAQLSAWARTSTPRDAMFLFADAGKALQPGIFRSEAERALYVDWKGGGQVNYLPELGAEWWKRWQATLSQPFDPRTAGRYQALAIDYIVLSPHNRLPDHTPVFENANYLVYRLMPAAGQ